MKKKILIAGGDKRQRYCAEELALQYDTAAFGFDERPPSVRQPEPGEKFDVLVLPVRPPESIGELAGYISDNGIILAGRTDSGLEAAFSGHEIISYLSREELTLRNAVPTAEGAVMLALEKLPVTLNGLPVLIVGMGRIGAVLCNILKGFGARTAAAVRSPGGAAKAECAGIDYYYTENIPAEKFPLVFNTSPEPVFKDEMLRRFPEGTLFIELASAPGGFDISDSELSGRLNIFSAPGIPGRNAPVTAGHIVADTVCNILKERGGNNE